MPMENIPLGTIIHNIEIKPGRGGQLARAAGSYAQLIGKDAGFAQLRLSSEKFVWCLPGVWPRWVRYQIRSQKSNMGKAGRSRWLGRRPSVRGVAMNPVDHPHGGGKGRTSGGRHPVSPWGVPAKVRKLEVRRRATNILCRRRKRKEAILARLFGRAHLWMAIY